MNSIQPDSVSGRLGVPGRAMVLAMGMSAIAIGGLYWDVSWTRRSINHPFLISRVNPNTADIPLLMTLPNIGSSRAAAIVEFRSQHRIGDRVFQRVEDLQAVKGIGPAISEGLRLWLEFETEIQPGGD